MQTPVFPLTRTQLVGLKTIQDTKIRTDTIQRQINDISNSIALSAKAR